VRSRWRGTLLLALITLALLGSTACGARLNHDQVAAVNSRNGGSQPPAQAQAAPAKATTQSATTAPAQPGQPVAADPGAAAAADPGAGAAPPPQAEGGCTPTGGNLDVGITDSSVTVASVATITGPVPGLFKNMQSGIKAYAAYVNSIGGICGRKLDVLYADDRLDAGTNRSETQRLMSQAFAFVGGYSVVDDGGADVLAGSGIPDIGSAIGAKRASMPENFATSPTEPGATSNGSQPQLQYFMQSYGVHKAAVVWPAQNDARNRGRAYVNDMKSVGLQIDDADQIEVAVTETNYVGVATKIKNDGVDIVITALEVNGISKLAQAFDQVGYKPKVPFYGQQTYGGQFLNLAGPSANGAVLALQHSIVEDRAQNPAMDTMATWYERANPGQDLDYFSIQGWIAGAMFGKALTQAGPSPTRALVLQQLQTFTAFDADGFIAPIDPAERKPSPCFVVVTVEDQKWKRVDPQTGFRCG
jgi:ABC-type branched-subunit amino acid transport system substrate-binding protein